MADLQLAALLTLRDAGAARQGHSTRAPQRYQGIGRQRDPLAGQCQLHTQTHRDSHPCTHSRAYSPCVQSTPELQPNYADARITLRGFSFSNYLALVGSREIKQRGNRAQTVDVYIEDLDDMADLLTPAIAR